MNIRLVLGDITEQDVDAVVNAANSSLLGGGGVDGAIHSRGGADILNECRRLRETTYPKGLPTGHAVATAGGQLRARWVIHTVGPVYSRKENRSPLLASAYRSALKVAEDLGIRSLAFPAISAGAYGWPIDDAAVIASAAVRRNQPRSLIDVRFVLFTRSAYAAFAEQLRSAGGPV